MSDLLDRLCKTCKTELHVKQVMKEEGNHFWILCPNCDMYKPQQPPQKGRRG